MGNIGLYIMGLKGLTVLKTILKNPEIKSNIAFVMAARDIAMLNDYFDEIYMLASENEINFHERTSSTTYIHADLQIAVGWRWLIEHNDSKLIVFHDSLLPKYSGFNPLPTALIAGDTEIGVTAIIANDTFDTGNIIGIHKLNISYPIKVAHAIEIISNVYAGLLLKILEEISKNNLVEIPQDNNGASYSLWRDEEDYKIDWSEDAEKIKRFIDAVGYPYKGAFCNYHERKIRVLDATTLDELNIINRTPGKVLSIHNNLPQVVCGKGLLQIDKAIYDDNGETVIFNKLRRRL